MARGRTLMPAALLVQVLAALLALCTAASAAPPMTRTQALAALARPDAAERVAALARLAEVGVFADAARVLDRLADVDPAVRDAAGAVVWSLWGRSGDAQVGRLFARGLAQMQAAELDDALATFDRIVRLKPGFAEGWNKRATVHFLLGHAEQSLKDCDEVFKRNPRHFGALSGAGQIHLQLGHLEQALDFFRRALQVNPNLDGPAQAVPLIEERLKELDKHRT